MRRHSRRAFAVQHSMIGVWLDGLWAMSLQSRSRPCKQVLRAAHDWHDTSVGPTVGHRGDMKPTRGGTKTHMCGSYRAVRSVVPMVVMKPDSSCDRGAVTAPYSAAAPATLRAGIMCTEFCCTACMGGIAAPQVYQQPAHK